MFPELAQAFKDYGYVFWIVPAAPFIGAVAALATTRLFPGSIREISFEWLRRRRQTREPVLRVLS